MQSGWVRLFNVSEVNFDIFPGEEKKFDYRINYFPPIPCKTYKCPKKKRIYILTEKSEVGLNSTTEMLGTTAYLKLACACKYDDDGPVDVTVVADVEGLRLPESERELIRSMCSKVSFKASFSSSMVREY